VESGVKYVKGNFLPTRTFRDLADLNAQARRWVLEEAGTRIHGTTRQQPLERFLIEKPLMKKLRIWAGKQSVSTLESHVLGQLLSAASKASADRHARWREETAGHTDGDFIMHLVQ
jgi:hypothetical protein